MKKPIKNLSPILNKEFLIKEYVLNKKSTIIIGKKLNCSHASVSNYLIKHKIRIRSFKEASSGELNGMFGIIRKGKNNPNYRTGRYENSRCYCPVCGKKVSRVGKCQRCSWDARHKVKYCIDCNASITLRSVHCKKCQLKNMPSGKIHPNYKQGKPKCLDCEKQLANYNVVRCKVCANLGENNPNWKDGASFEIYPLEFNEKLKAKVRKRDNYTCQNCRMTEEEHIIVLGRNLPVHHIDYNKKNCDETNLIALCNQCNLRANANRDYWEKYFLEKLAKKL